MRSRHPAFIYVILGLDPRIHQKNTISTTLMDGSVKRDHGNAAIKREKRLKYYQRQWKIDLIEKQNPSWEDLYTSLHGSCGQAAG